MDKVILIGFMGTGKSTVGEALAKRLNCPYVDLDQLIVEREKRSIPDIFAAEGEAYFRRVESELLRESLQKPGRQVITTGGGVVLRPENVTAMLAGGVVVNLKATAEEIIRRVSGDTQRPLLRGDVKQRVYQLLRERAGMYDFAPLQIETTNRSVAAIVDEIMGRLVAQSDFWRE